MDYPSWFDKLKIPSDCITKKSSAKEQQSSFAIQPAPNDQIWRVKVDGCWLQDKDGRKVDYLFWGQSQTHWQVTLLVELKGRDYGSALQQIEATLLRLGQHYEGALQAHVILSKGTGVPLRQREVERLRKVYKIRVYPHTIRFECKHLDALKSK